MQDHPSNEDNDTFSLDNAHLSAPLLSIADDKHVPLQPLLCKMWIGCHVLELGEESSFTALVLLHRYYYFYFEQQQHREKESKLIHEDDASHEWKWIGAACLVLGMKAEEESRRLRDVINVAHMLDFDMDTKSAGLVFDVSSDPPELNEIYWKAKEMIVATEQMVLRVLQFDIMVGHPHRLVVLIAQDLGLPDGVVQQAWSHLNDALWYAPALTLGALPMACAAVELVVKRGPDTYYDSGVGFVKRGMLNLKAATQHLQRMTC
jgi:Cyclin, N-terminal domain